MRARGWTTELLLRHEIGHCNGWPSDHSDPKNPPAGWPAIYLNSGSAEDKPRADAREGGDEKPVQKPVEKPVGRVGDTPVIHPIYRCPGFNRDCSKRLGNRPATPREGTNGEIDRRWP